MTPERRRPGSARSGGRALAVGAALVLAIGCTTSDPTTQPTFAPLEITTETLPDAVLGLGYAADVEVIGGDLNYTWSLIDGAPPPGLSLDSGSGTISGQATVLGGSSFMIQVTSGDGQLVSRQLGITVVP